MSEFFKYAKVHKDFFLRHGQPAFYNKGNQIVRAGEPNKWVYFLINGYVKVSFTVTDGSERIIGYFIPGMTFAQFGSFYDKPDSRLEFEAVSKVETYRLHSERFIKQLRSDLEFSADYINRLSYSQIFQIDRIVYQGEKGVRNKVIRWLLFMAKFYGEPVHNASCRIYIPLTQDIAANFLHATRESVSAVMRELTRKKLIKTERKIITITDLNKLEAELR